MPHETATDRDSPARLLVNVADLRRRLGQLVAQRPDDEVSEGDLDAFLIDLVEAGLLLESRRRYLALAVYHPARTELPPSPTSIPVAPIHRG